MLLPMGMSLACATASPSDTDAAGWKAELLAQRRIQDAALDRMERLEARVRALEAVGRSTSEAVIPADPLAGLPVVRLAPEAVRAGASSAPPLDTRIALREPSDSELALLRRPARTVNLDQVQERAEPAAEFAFAAAVRRYNQGEFVAAGEALEAFADRYPNHDAADNGLYLAGMTFVARGQCGEAKKRFTRVLSAFPDADAAGPSLLALAQCESSLGRADQARSLFQKVLDEHPRTAEASQAEAALAALPGKEAPPAEGRP